MKIYHVDAFAEELFTGNAASVIPLEKWMPDELMQKIAMENNLAENDLQTKITWRNYHGKR